MTTPEPSPNKFVRLSRPAVPVVRLIAEHEPTDTPVSTGVWVRVSRPAVPVVILAAEPVESTATIHLKLPLLAGTDGNQVFERLHAIVGKVNEMEALGDRAGVWVDGSRSGVQGGEVVIVLVPNDPANAVETCKRVANILFNASPRVTLTVFAADQPETPIYDLKS